MMLDMRKPYLLSIKDRTHELNFFEDPRSLPSIAIKAKVDTWGVEKGLNLFCYDVGCERGHVLPGNRELEKIWRWRYATHRVFHSDY